MTIPTPTRINNKLKGEFYPLQKAELIKLYQVGLIKSAAYVHFALRLENPFCDRPIEIIPKEFALRWGIPEKSVYRAIARLKELDILKIKSGKIVVAWIDEIENPENPEGEKDSVDFEDCESSTNVSKILRSEKNSQSCEKILRSEKKFSEVRKNSQKWENKTLEALQSIAPNSAQTIQNYQTTQKEDLKNSQIQENTIDQKNECINTQIESSKKTEQSELSNKGNFPRGVIQDNSEELEIDYRFGIPEELKKRLQRVDIHLDRKVVDAIACHDISQVLGALNHIENTRDNIKNTRSVFLFQLPKQPIEKLGARLPEIGSAMAMEIKQLEEVSKTPEYQQKRKEHFEIIKATLKKNASTG